ncbi:MAG: hypothetical protein N3A68_02190 [Bacteroidia bacterium]|nr:hypothetical protein [Bacteroidia bacterium]GIV23256.1 MAG: hypothetical protein KatS3mg025_0915 [Bacteroidia bacterium]
MKTSRIFLGLLLVVGATYGQNVGIGTANPQMRLHVMGGIRSEGIAPDDATPNIDARIELVNRGAGGTQYIWRIYTAAVGGGFGVNPNAWEVWEYPPSGTPGCCLPRFRIYPAGGTASPPGEVVINQAGFVGIGTAAPDVRLVVNGPIRIAGLQNSFRLFFSDNSSDQTKYIATENFWLTLGAHSNEGFRFKDQNGTTQAQIGLGTNVSYILSNVGIGTATPAQRLHVAGTIRADNLSGTHPGSQTYSALGTNTTGDIIRVNPTHGYLFTVVQPCDFTQEGTIRAQITSGTLTIDCYNEGGAYVKNCYTLNGVANARIALLIVNDDTGNCGGTARISGVRSLTVTNGGGLASANTDLGCNGSDGNNWVLFIHYNPL